MSMCQVRLCGFDCFYLTKLRANYRVSAKFDFHPWFKISGKKKMSGKIA
jgi:hypothetical protein